MAKKLVIMKGGSGKPVSLPASLADGLVKMRRARYADEPKPAVAPKPKAKVEHKPKLKAEAKAPTYATRAMTAAKPDAAPKKTWPYAASADKAEEPKAKPAATKDEA